MGKAMLSLCDSLADGSREHQPVPLVPEDSSHHAKVSWGNLLAPKKPEGVWQQMQLLKWNWIFFTAL